MTGGLPEHEDECFFIAPIGAEDSEVRKRSDGVRDFIVKPAVEELGLTTLRADEIAKPGQITLQVIEHVLRAKAAVADLTGTNANVYYEMAVRHAARLPIVLIADQKEIDAGLPFDIAGMRVIAFDHTDLKSAADAKKSITQQLREAIGGAVDSPIATALNLEVLSQGNPVEKALADLVARVEALAQANAEVVRLAGSREPIHDFRPIISSRPKTISSQITRDIGGTEWTITARLDEETNRWRITGESADGGESVSWMESSLPDGDDMAATIEMLMDDMERSDVEAEPDMDDIGD